MRPSLPWWGSMPFSKAFAAILGSKPSFLWRTTSVVTASISFPYGTPDGHAVSHARHWMHRSQCLKTVGLGPMRPSLAAFIRAIRPRGDSVSSPVSRYVGHACRQKPQWTHL